MNTTVVIIIGLVIAPFILKAMALTIWQVVEIPYRIVMFVIYGILYISVCAWDAICWLIRVLFRRDR